MNTSMTYEALATATPVFNLNLEDIVIFEEKYMRIIQLSSKRWSFPSCHRSILHGSIHKIRLVPINFQYEDYLWSDRSKEDWDRYWSHIEAERQRFLKESRSLEYPHWIELFKVDELPF